PARYSGSALHATASSTSRCMDSGGGRLGGAGADEDAVAVEAHGVACQAEARRGRVDEAPAGDVVAPGVPHADDRALPHEPVGQGDAVVHAGVFERVELPAEVGCPTGHSPDAPALELL